MLVRAGRTGRQIFTEPTMDFLQDLPLAWLAVLIFLLRMTDVALGTMRVISVVHGHLVTAVVLGFFEICIWVVAVTQVVLTLGDQPFLILFYAGGFAAGNAAGILLERRLAMGTCLVTMISSDKGQEVAAALRELGQRLTTVQGEGRDGPRDLIYVGMPRRQLRQAVSAATAIDPELFYMVQFTSRTNHRLGRQSAQPGRGGMKHK
jgi:uncharacterized protein YebE (UPF0316 family)